MLGTTGWLQLANRFKGELKMYSHYYDKIVSDYSIKVESTIKYKKKNRIKRP